MCGKDGGRWLASRQREIDNEINDGPVLQSFEVDQWLDRRKKCSKQSLALPFIVIDTRVTIILLWMALKADYDYRVSRTCPWSLYFTVKLQKRSAASYGGNDFSIYLTDTTSSLIYWYVANMQIGDMKIIRDINFIASTFQLHCTRVCQSEWHNNILWQKKWKVTFYA